MGCFVGTTIYGQTHIGISLVLFQLMARVKLHNNKLQHLILVSHVLKLFVQSIPMNLQLQQNWEESCIKMGGCQSRGTPKIIPY